ncbi:MAG: MarR family transcriptional regulator [Thermoplasmata archaeon]|nr:MarR family transcriptional regulator [Thermoplasmata archaeon]MCI4355764.1 MarR family transcriptional regulator [Thermoplasmata archaeon]
MNRGGEFGAGEAMLFAMRSVFGTSRRKLGRIGLTLPQASLLSIVALHGPLTPSELARRSQVSRQAMTSAVNALERRGLVDRLRSSTDRRSLRIEVTPRAERLFVAMVPEMHELHHRIDQLFTAEERATLVALLTRIGREFRPSESLEVPRCAICASADPRGGAG